MSLNALALTLVDQDPHRAKALLCESVERSSTPGESPSCADRLAVPPPRWASGFTTTDIGGGSTNCTEPL